jgi:hypothetical protein
MAKPDGDISSSPSSESSEKIGITWLVEGESFRGIWVDLGRATPRRGGCVVDIDMVDSLCAASISFDFLR